MFALFTSFTSLDRITSWKHRSDKNGLKAYFSISEPKETNEGWTLYYSYYYYFLNLNCCGLVRKSQNPEFAELINDYDFVCLNETKTNDLDSVYIPGYTFKFKNRKTKSKKVKSGGIAFGYKSELENDVTQLDTDSPHIFWLTLSDSYLNIGSDLVIGNIYIPPENSI